VAQRCLCDHQVNSKQQQNSIHLLGLLPCNMCRMLDVSKTDPINSISAVCTPWLPRQSIPRSLFAHLASAPFLRKIFCLLLWPMRTGAATALRWMHWLTFCMTYKVRMINGMHLPHTQNADRRYGQMVFDTVRKFHNVSMLFMPGYELGMGVYPVNTPNNPAFSRCQASCQHNV
jgi:hypothetical protein